MYDSEVIMNNNQCIIFTVEGVRLLMHIRECHRTPTVHWINIHKKQASLRVCMWFPGQFGDSPRYTQSSLQHSDVFPNFSQSLPSYLYQSSEIPVTHVPVNKDPGYFEGRPERPPRVWYPLEMNATKVALNILSDTPAGCQRLKDLLLMKVHREMRDLLIVGDSRSCDDAVLGLCSSRCM